MLSSNSSQSFPLAGGAHAGSLSSWHTVNAPAPLWPWGPSAPFYQCLLALCCPAWTQYSGYSLVSAELKGAVTSLAMWAGLLFLQPWRLLPFLGARAHCWQPLLAVCPAKFPVHFLQRCCQPVSSQPVSLQGALPSWYTAVFVFAELCVSCQPVSPVCLGLTEWGLLSLLQTSSLIHCHVYNCIFFVFYFKDSTILIINNIYFSFSEGYHLIIKRTIL